VTLLAVPPGFAYAVVLFEKPPRTAFCRTIESVVRCLTDNDIAFDCEVVRVSDDKLVWPIHCKGGDA
jgi:hypothetical protein